MISINFATTNYRLQDRVQRALSAGILVFITAAVAIALAGFSLRASIAATDGKIAEILAHGDQFRSVLQERDTILKDLSVMSRLTDSRRFSWTRLLTSIEKSFPQGVALDKIEYNPRDRALNFDGRALSPEALRNLMIGMERAAVFREPYLKHQSVDKGSITFNVVAFYQESQPAALDQGK